MKIKNILFDFLSKYITLNADEKKAIIALDIFKHYKKGTVLMKEGQFSNYGYFLIKGCIKCYYKTDTDEEATDFYNELETLQSISDYSCNKPSEYFVACTEDSIVILANSEMEKIIFRKFPKFETLCRILSEELLANCQTEFNNLKTSLLESKIVILNGIYFINLRDQLKTINHNIFVEHCMNYT